MTKECSKCKIVKGVSEFGVCKLVKSGLYPSCKQCRSEIGRETTKLKKLKKEEELKNNPPPPKVDKKCSKCKEVKSLNLFVAHKLTKDGKAPSCKDCMKKERNNNEDRIKRNNKEYYKKIKNTDQYKQRSKKYYQNNSTKIKRRVKQHYLQNKDVMSKKANLRKSKKYYSNDSFNLLCKIRAMILRTIKGRKCRSIFYTGAASPEEFLNYMNSKTNNPNWISDKYQIDHIWQIHWFTESLEKDPESVSQVIHHYKNLRPIPAYQNINRDKYDYTCLDIKDFDYYKPYLNQDIINGLIKHFGI